MQLTVEPSALGLDPNDLDGERERERERRARKEAEKRTINFANTPLDTRREDFASSLVAIAADRMSDGDWPTPSRRRFSLTDQTAREQRKLGQPKKRRVGQEGDVQCRTEVPPCTKKKKK